jgi:hypothetical protein
MMNFYNWFTRHKRSTATKTVSQTGMPIGKLVYYTKKVLLISLVHGMPIDVGLMALLPVLTLV